VLALAVLAGCAGRSGARQAREAPSPARIYTVGEERYAAGRYEEAVELWRHAILELPPTAANDELRHQLILRLAYGQLMAWSQTGNAAHLDDAKQMLERYLERHEHLFGENERALAERGQVYELLFEVERQLEPPPDEAAEESEEVIAEAAASEDAGTSEARGDASRELPVVAAARGDADRELADAVAEANAAEKARYADDGERRLIVVPRDRDTASPDQLRSAFTNPDAGLLLTAPGYALIHGPRPLLRAGIARPAEDDVPLESRVHARRLGATLVEQARPALAECYDAAFARDPVDVARSTVEVAVDEHGRVHEAAIVEGGLVDLLGDLCLVQQLERTQLAESPGPGRIRVPLTFFYQGPVLINEGTGETMPLKIADVLEWFSAPRAQPPR